MCTVTFIPKGTSDFILTSNRDEAPSRVTLPPAIYKSGDIKLLFPKDELAGGTWIGLSNKSRLICLLNGGFTLHERKAQYRLSRGVVVKDLLTCNSIIESINNYNLFDIEPFTMVIVDWIDELQLLELVWDGEKKSFKKLPMAPKLWSSSTLYNTHMKTERQQWFGTFIEKNSFSSDTIMNFHKTAGKGNADFGIIMDRGFVKTTSITQVEKSLHGVAMIFNDLQKQEALKTMFTISEMVNE